jgi:hypothetical protein
MSHSSSILNKRHNYRHTYKIHQRKTHACNEPRIDESSSFFCPTLLCAISFSFFSSPSFPSRFFFYSKINFPSSSSTDGPVAIISFFSHIFFAIPTGLNALYVDRTWRRKKKPKKIFFSQQTFFYCDIWHHVNFFWKKS